MTTADAAAASPPTTETTVRVRVPATSANLGPGFDTLGLALALHDELTVRVLAPGAATVVDVDGEGADDLPRDASHLVVRALHMVFRDAGRAVPAVHLACTNRLPQARGLGSSAAAAVAGVVAGQALLGLGDRADDALRLAVALEGHPDNAAACLHGGLTVAWDEDGRPRVARPVPHPDLRAVVCVPDLRASTEQARGALPLQVPHRDAAANAARSALLVHALTAEPSLLLPATEDRLHQPYRAAGQPATTRLVSELRATGLAACTSGAGPSVLVLADRDVHGQVAGVLASQADRWDAHPLSVDLVGATVAV